MTMGMMMVMWKRMDGILKTEIKPKSEESPLACAALSMVRGSFRKSHR